LYHAFANLQDLRHAKLAQPTRHPPLPPANFNTLPGAGNALAVESQELALLSRERYWAESMDALLSELTLAPIRLPEIVWDATPPWAAGDARAEP
jgi:hypothetical protein